MWHYLCIIQAFYILYSQTNISNQINTFIVALLETKSEKINELIDNKTRNIQDEELSKIKLEIEQKMKQEMKEMKYILYGAPSTTLSYSAVNDNSKFVSLQTQLQEIDAFKPEFVRQRQGKTADFDSDLWIYG